MTKTKIKARGADECRWRAKKLQTHQWMVQFGSGSIHPERYKDAEKALQAMVPYLSGRELARVRFLAPNGVRLSWTAAAYMVWGVLATGKTLH